VSSAEQRCYHLGLIGYPLGHSLSPILHQAALNAYGLEGEYQLFPIPPTPEGETKMAALFARMRKGEIDGLNVTIPHKQNVYRYIDRLSSTAEMVKAVNTIYRDDSGSLVGDNTDVPGFTLDLSHLVTQRAGKAIVLGAGGSARAVIFALCQSGWEVVILARRQEQAEALTAEFAMVASGTWQMASGTLERSSMEKASPGCSLLVNTTPVGMFPHPDENPWPADLALPENAAVYDLIYNPLNTQLLQYARQSRLPVSNGSGMLVSQAALAFAHWTGLDAPFAVMGQAFPQRL
jgi:shikimate dehydrogenase